MSDKIALIALASILLLTSSQDESPEEVRTKRLVIVDPQDRPRILAEASPVPRLVFKSESGQELIRLAIGGDSESFPFGLENVPHLTLETGETRLTLSVHPAPQAKNLDEQFLVESANIALHTQDEKRVGKFLNLGVFPNKAVFRINTISPQNPLGLLEPDVELFVDAEGRATTKLRSSEENR